MYGSKIKIYHFVTYNVFQETLKTVIFKEDEIFTNVSYISIKQIIKMFRAAYENVVFLATNI